MQLRRFRGFVLVRNFTLARCHITCMVRVPCFPLT